MNNSVFEYKDYLKLRLWLKIGLAQEKKGSYDQAAVAYEKAVQISNSYFNFLKNNLATRIYSDDSGFKFERVNDLKLFYQPLLCRIYLQEKSNANAHADFQMVDEFFDVLKNIIEHKSVDNSFSTANLQLYYADCLNKIGDLYFFKGHTPFNLKKNEPVKSNLQFLNRAEQYYSQSITCLLKAYFSNYKQVIKKKFSESCNYDVKVLLEIFMITGDILNDPRDYLIPTPTAEIYSLLGNNLSDLGNVYLSQRDVKKSVASVSASELIIYFKFLKRLLLKEEKEALTEQEIKKLLDLVETNHIIKITSCYVLAARLFLRASMHKECAFEYEKVLRLLNHIPIELANKLPAYKLNEINSLLNILEEVVFERSKKHYHLAYRNIHRIMQLETRTNKDYLQEPSEVSCLTIYWYRLQNKLIKSIDKESRQNSPLYRQINEFVKTISQEDYFNSIRERIDRLNFKQSKHNEFFLDLIMNSQNTNYLEDFGDEKEWIEQYLSSKTKTFDELLNHIKDGLFCCYHSIVLRELHRNTYWWLHLGRGFMHLYLARWAWRYKIVFNYVRKMNIISETEILQKRNEIEKYLGSKNMKYIDATYQLQQALENFNQVKETHTNGQAYKNLIQRMYFLNDDFSDREYHFLLAGERAALQREEVDDIIRKVEAWLAQIKKEKPGRA